MRFETRTVMGRDREANNDRARAACAKDYALFVIADGTSKPGSGQLADYFVSAVIDAYQTRMSCAAINSSPVDNEQILRSVLNSAHVRSFECQTGTTCYLVGAVTQGMLTIAYEGDCSCGLANTLGSIDWLTSPHCKANWRRDRSHRDLASDPARNLVTRCLKAGRATDPDFVFHPLVAGSRLIFATDGFWAELTDEQQNSLLACPTGEIVDISDDVTWIDVQL